MATQTEIARKLGLSQMTVSRVLNDSPLVTAATKQRVLGEMRKRGYALNVSARNLVSRRTGTIGVLVPGGLGMYSPTFLPALCGIGDEAGSRHLNMLLVTAEGWRDCRLKLGEAAPKTDGFIVFNFEEFRPFAGRILKQLRERGKSVVLIQPFKPHHRVPYVTIDNESGGRQAAEHLIGLGHRRLGCIGLGYRSKEMDARLAGFLGGCRAAGIEVPDRWICQGTKPYTTSVAPFFSCLGSDLPTGIFAFSDRVARLVLYECAGRGISVPEELSVVGFNDDAFAQMMLPHLTTIRQLLYEAGVEAVGRLLPVARGEDPVPLGLALEPALVVRDSTRRVGEGGGSSRG